MSYTAFSPGNKSGAKRMIQYSVIANSQEQCACVNNVYNKLVVSSDSPSTRISNNRRIAQIVNYSKGGKSQYGNFYLGKPLNINYLGREEGMSGGSGSPPTNF